MYSAACKGMSTTYKINVTWADLWRGDPESITSCPVARAFRRCTRIEDIRVGTTIGYIRLPGQNTREFSLPYGVAEKIVTLCNIRGRWTRALAVRPFSFLFTIPL